MAERLNEGGDEVATVPVRFSFTEPPRRPEFWFTHVFPCSSLPNVDLNVDLATFV